MGKAAVHDVYPHILKALDAHAQDDLLQDEIARNCVTNAVASLKTTVCKSARHSFIVHRQTMTLTKLKTYLLTENSVVTLVLIRLNDVSVRLLSLLFLVIYYAIRSNGRYQESKNAISGSSGGS